MTESDRLLREARRTAIRKTLVAFGKIDWQSSDPDLVADAILDALARLSDHSTEPRE